MLTVQDVSREVKDLLFEINTLPKSNDPKVKRQHLKERKLAEKRIKYLNTIKLYLETNPNIEFVKSEVYRLKTAIDIHVNRFSMSTIANEPSLVTKQRKKQYEKEHSLPKLRTQLKNLQFILKGK